MAIVTHGVLAQALAAGEFRDREVNIRRVAGMQGPNRVILVLDESCPEDFVVATNSSGQSFGAGAAVLTGKVGLTTSELVLSRPPPGAGSTTAPRTTTINQGPGLPTSREYRSLVQDPTDSDKLHILRYFDGVFSSVVKTIDFADGRNIGSSLEAATPIKDVPGVPDGLAFPLVSPGGEFSYRVINEATGSFSEATTTTGATGAHASGTLYIQGSSLFAGGVIDVNAAPDDYKLFRMTLPGISDLTEVTALPLPGGSLYFFPGVWMPDRHRLPERNGGVWAGLDDSLFSGSTLATADIINLDAPQRIWPLGHDGTDGYFLWASGGIGSGGPLKFGKVPTSGSGIDLEFNSDWEDDFVQNVIFSGAWPNRFVTVVGVKSPSQDPAVAEPRVATLAFTGSPTALPEPFTVELAEAEAALGLGPGEAYPFAFLPWFP